VAEYRDVNADTAAAVGTLDARERSQGFKVKADCEVTFIELLIKVSAAVADNLLVEIQTDAAGFPSNTAITNGTSVPVPGEGLDLTAYSRLAFRFATRPNLVADTQYHIVAKRSGGYGSPYCQWGGDGSSPTYPDGAGAYKDLTGWHAAGMDMCFSVHGIATAPTASRALWLLSADGSTGYLHRQMHPFPGWNPLLEDGSQFEQGPLTHYLPWLDLVAGGEWAGVLREVAAQGYVNREETIIVECRFAYDPRDPESSSTAWQPLATFDDRYQSALANIGRSQPAGSVQFRFTLTRGGGGHTVRTPVVRAQGVYFEAVPKMGRVRRG
jgi:hypothetical protein